MSDTAGLAAGLRQLADAAGTLRADDQGVWQVLDSAEQAVNVIGRHGSPADLDVAVAACTHAGGAASDGLLAAIFQGLRGTVLLQRFEQTGQRDDLNASISARQQSADALPEPHPARNAALANLVPVLELRFRLTRMPADLDAAIGIGR